MALFNATKAAGDKVAALKKAKASKDEITAAVKILLDNKAKYKEALGHDYDAKKPPQAAASAAAAPAAGNDAMALFNATKAAGDKVAALKKAKASKDEVTAAVKVLLDNKAKYKAALGHDYDANKPPQPAASAPAAPASAASNDAMALFNATKASGDKVAALKKAKAPKDEITAAVKILLDNKANYIAAVGSDYDANKPPQSAAAAAPVATKSSGSSNAMALFNETKAAGDKVAALKKAKAPKDEITAAVQVLLANKAKYKEALGHDYDAKKPPQQEKAAANTSSSADDQAMALFNETKAAGDKVAALKKAKAPKDEITAAVQVLLANKAKYKAALGHDYDAKKPPVSTTNLTNSVDSNNNPITLSETKKPSGDQNPSNPNPNMEAMNFYNACKTAGDQVRKLKAEKADISEALAKLKDSKAAYKNALGHDYNEKKPPTGVASPEAKGDTARAATPKQTKKDKKEKKEKVKKVDENIKGKTKLGVSAKKELATLSDWYTQTITKAEMIEYYTVSGCYILRPWSFSIWEGIQSFFDAKIKKLGVKNSYFPMFVSKSALEKEQDHIDDFAPEVAWVTKSGQSELEEPIAIRPTSETVMYPAYAKWVQSHRDLPIKLNQWCNVVRWEFKGG